MNKRDDGVKSQLNERLVIDDFFQHVEDMTPKVVVIGGMAKAGTTLPLTLLDSHPELVVYSEELRFFHCGCDENDGEAAERFLSNQNTKRFTLDQHDFGVDNYKAHAGTGFGKVDYSDFNFALFEKLIRQSFDYFPQPRRRFHAVVAAYLVAQGRSLTDRSVTFVCKAPHNELYAQKWVDMLGESGKYVICVRDPLEHFLSRMTVRSMGGFNYDCYNHINEVKYRLKLLNVLPKAALCILDYDDLITDTSVVMEKLASFLGITYNENLLCPTKNGVPWGGNSSRGIVGNKVFKNPKIAREKLPASVVRAIEVGLYHFMMERGYAVSKKATISERLTSAIILVYKSNVITLLKLTWFGKMICQLKKFGRKYLIRKNDI